MKNRVLVFVGLFAVTSAAFVPEEVTLRSFDFDNDVFDVRPLKGDTSPRLLSEYAQRGLVLNSIGSKLVKSLIEQLQTGWPESGIPPLAPYTKDELVYELKNTFAELFVKIENFSIIGLDDMEISQLKISYTLSQKVKFSFIFPKIVISGKYLSESVIDVMNEYGSRINIDTKGDLELVFENITFQGQFKYEMPIIFGSIKVYKFDGSLSLGGVASRVGGFMGNGKLNQLLNSKIEEILMKLVSSNQDKISARLRDTLVPFVNKELEGNNIWSFIG